MGVVVPGEKKNSCIFKAVCAQSRNKYVFRMFVLLEERETSLRTVGADGTYDGIALQYVSD